MSKRNQEEAFASSSAAKRTRSSGGRYACAALPDGLRCLSEHDPLWSAADSRRVGPVFDTREECERSCGLLRGLPLELRSSVTAYVPLSQSAGLRATARQEQAEFHLANCQRMRLERPLLWELAGGRVHGQVQPESCRRAGIECGASDPDKACRLLDEAVPRFEDVFTVIHHRRKVDTPGELGERNTNANYQANRAFYVNNAPVRRLVVDARRGREPVFREGQWIRFEMPTETLLARLTLDDIELVPGVEVPSADGRAGGLEFVVRLISINGSPMTVVGQLVLPQPQNWIIRKLSAGELHEETFELDRLARLLRPHDAAPQSDHTRLASLEDPRSWGFDANDLRSFLRANGVPLQHVVPGDVERPYPGDGSITYDPLLVHLETDGVQSFASGSGW
ncbi:Hypothetical protein UVM_LOCUS377 [uncultured virus]|nr:Hypothetical protein UVM_LOCUS377 [uncultured virus]